MTGGSSPRDWSERGETMLTPDEVAAMLRLHELGWGSSGSRRSLAVPATRCSTTWRRAAGRRNGVASAGAGWRVWSAWLRSGSAAPRQRDVVRQDLAREHGIAVSLRTLERAVAPLRAGLQREARATLRFETPPGRQLQIDFGEKRVSIGGVTVKLHSCSWRRSATRAGCMCGRSATSGSRRGSPAWKRAFRHFSGVPQEVLLDNARALVDHHDAADPRGAIQRAAAGVCPVLGLPPARLRAVSGADEGQGRERRRIREAQRAWPAIASTVGRRWRRILRAGCARWPTRASTARPSEPPRDRGLRATEAAASAAAERPPAVRQVRELVRRVGRDCAIELDTNSYSVPWRLIGERVAVTPVAGTCAIRHGRPEVAAHAEVARAPAAGHRASHCTA